jgi:hypothetical protein
VFRCCHGDDDETTGIRSGSNKANVYRTNSFCSSPVDLSCDRGVKTTFVMNLIFRPILCRTGFIVDTHTLHYIYKDTDNCDVR